MAQDKKFKALAALILALLTLPITSVSAYCGSGEPEATTSIFSDNVDGILAFTNVNFTSATYSGGALMLGASASSKRALWLYSPYPCIDNGDVTYTFYTSWYVSGSGFSITIDVYDENLNLINSYTRTTTGYFAKYYSASTPKILIAVTFGSTAPTTFRLDDVGITASSQLYRFPITVYGSALTPAAISTPIDIYVSPKTSSVKFMTKPDGSSYIFHRQNSPIPYIQINSVKYYYIQPNERILNGGSAYSIYILDTNDVIEFGTLIEAYQIDLNNDSVNCGSGIASAVKSISVQLVGSKPAYFVIGRNPSTYEAEGIAGAILVDSNPLYVPYSGGGGIEPPEYNPPTVVTGNISISYPSAGDFNSTMVSLIAEYAAGNEWFSYAVMCIPFLLLFTVGRKYMWLVGLFSVGICLVINAAAGAELWQQGALGVTAFICLMVGIKEGMS